MAQAEIGALRVTLAMNAGEFQKGAKDAEGSLDRLAKAFGVSASTAKMAGAAIGAAFAAVGAGIALAAKRSLDQLDEINKLSQKIGVPVEQLSVLAYAADLADVSLEELGKGFKLLSKNMEEIASGNAKLPAARALEALGISATTASGQLKTSEQVMLEVADKFAVMQDGAGKTALAMMVFGKSGAELIPLLNQGGASIRQMSNEAKALGLVFDKDAAQAAENVNDNLRRLQKAYDGFTTQLTIHVLPALADYTESLANTVIQGNYVEKSTQGIIGKFNDLSAHSRLLTADFENYKASLIATGDYLYKLMTFDFSGLSEAVKKNFAEMNNRMLEAQNNIAPVAEGMARVGGAVQAANDNVQKFLPPIVQSTKALSEAEREHNRLVQEGMDLIKQSLDPYEQLEKKMEALNAAFADHKITAQQLGVAQSRAAWAAQNAYAGMASGIMGSLEQAFEGNKAVAIASALVNTYEAFTKALATYPPPFSYVAAAAALAAGMAQVANIRKTTKTSTGGGSSGSTAPAAPDTSGAGVQQGVYVTLNGQSFGREQVLGLIEQINEAVKDGAKIVVR